MSSLGKVCICSTASDHTGVVCGGTMVVVIKDGVWFEVVICWPILCVSHCAASFCLSSPFQPLLNRTSGIFFAHF